MNYSRLYEKTRNWEDCRADSGKFELIGRENVSSKNRT